MPLPKSRDPGKIIRALKHEKPSMPQRQRVAIALDAARRHGAKIPRGSGAITDRDLIRGFIKK